MARLRKRHLPYRVTIRRLIGETAESGETWSAPDIVPAYVEQKARLVVDRRSPSPTKGQEVTSSTTLVVFLKDDAMPRSRVTVWAGTPRERTSEVIASSYGDYPGTPAHAQLNLE